MLSSLIRQVSVLPTKSSLWPSVLTRSSLPKPQRNQHVQNCVRWEMAHRLERLQSDIHYCYQCFDWIVGEEWGPHCQSHLAGMVTKRCGTITYCHTLVRPGYCPFCLSDPASPASKRLESWTRDHKLWNHVNIHLGQCRWPRVCPHPLCDALANDGVALQFHFMDEHGFSRARPGKAACSEVSDSLGKNVSLDDEVQAPLFNRKRKFSSVTTKLEWITPRSAHDLSVSGQDFSHSHLPKRPWPIPPAISPIDLTTDGAVSDDQSTRNVVDAAMFPPHFSPSIEERTDTECRSLPIYCTDPQQDTDAPKSEDGDCDTLFDQYLRSPSPSPPLRSATSPDDASSQLSGITLADAGCVEPWESVRPRTASLESAASLAIGEDMAPATQGREDVARVSGRHRIQLRVSQPRITLRLKLQDASPRGKNEKEGKKKQKTVQLKRQRRRAGLI